MREVLAKGAVVTEAAGEEREAAGDERGGRGGERRRGGEGAVVGASALKLESSSPSSTYGRPAWLVERPCGRDDRTSQCRRPVTVGARLAAAEAAAAAAARVERAPSPS